MTTLKEQLKYLNKIKSKYRYFYFADDVVQDCLLYIHRKNIKQVNRKYLYNLFKFYLLNYIKKNKKQKEIIQKIIENKKNFYYLPEYN